MLRPISQAMRAGNHRDTEDGETEHPGDRLHFGVEIVEIGAGADIHVEAGHRYRVADLADRRFLAGLHIFVSQQDGAVGFDAIHQLARQFPAIGHHVHAVGTDLLGIRRHHGDAVIEVPNRYPAPLS